MSCRTRRDCRNIPLSNLESDKQEGLQELSLQQELKKPCPASRHIKQGSKEPSPELEEDKQQVSKESSFSQTNQEGPMGPEPLLLAQCPEDTREGQSKPLGESLSRVENQSFSGASGEEMACELNNVVILRGLTPAANLSKSDMSSDDHSLSEYMPDSTDSEEETCPGLEVMASSEKTSHGTDAKEGKRG